ncbi:IS1167 transposase [Streptococcus pneumoniae]|nr:IS1167 transposase [Streptococcus pneumoniae]
MEQLHFITKLLDIKDPNVQILDIINKDTHKEIIAKLDYDAPSCPECGNQLKKYDFQKPSQSTCSGARALTSFSVLSQVSFPFSKRLYSSQNP